MTRAGQKPNQLLTTNNYPSNSISIHHCYSCIQIYELSHQDKHHATPIPVVRGCELGGCPRRRLESRALPGADGAGGPSLLRELLEGGVDEGIGDGWRRGNGQAAWEGTSDLRGQWHPRLPRERGRRREKFPFCRG